MKKADSSRLNAQRAGNLAHQKALERYYADPNYCKQCGKLIKVRENDCVSHTKTKKFCNASCAATFNNRGINRHVASQSEKLEAKGYLSDRKKQSPNEATVVFYSHTECDRCGHIIPLKKQKRKGYVNRKYCDVCLPIVKKEVYKEMHTKNGTALPKPLEEFTKKELFDYKGDQKARIAITENARRTYRRSNRPKSCHICGYDFSVDVCHIRDVSDFPDDALISEINAPSNLVGLCPNHHREFDRHHFSILSP